MTVHRHLRLQQLLREAELVVLELAQHIHQNLLFNEGAGAIHHLGQTIKGATEEFCDFPAPETKEHLS